MIGSLIVELIGMLMLLRREIWKGVDIAGVVGAVVAVGFVMQIVRELIG